MIRLATLADAPALAAVHIRSSQGSEPGYAVFDFPALSKGGKVFSPWTKIITERPEDVAVFELPSGIVGFASLCLSQDDDATPGTGELTGIYLDPQFWGKGIAQRLMEWAKTAARSRHWHKLTLWVLSDNEQARSFYKATGWGPDGGRKTDAFNGEEIVEIRYTWRCGE